ncbi:zinc finger Ran-binding domain-containing protein 2-like isoform X1 [Sesamum indicum]|uniref:Zinc finger Ran-binding domain-containing protein 2-like isoform X1 n=2 Tax=Sesamum indicum TaxID=4182 RepID=A0A6I9TEG4_SESIN|nr:zinc finger Ran-binding domain-containing protein 2-like isoform X1 [Sesamum indicum]XP_011081201.1 zinc finger Ran-binding domain-containing protein 2-like isoform X1 [Sesamum indicum]
MPKDRRVNSSSFDRATVSPYSCSSKISDRKNCDSSSPQVGDEREWEEARCPICMEHPHNAVLLLCSSREKGCRPFICDTSYRHSNCLDQYRKSAAASCLPGEQQSELVCPLCRGVITGWDVIQPARTFMNSKMRSCSLETCGFTGNYAELRKHARLEHPYERPSEASPTRQSNWALLEQQREIEDALAHQSDIEYDWDGWPSWDEWGEDDLWSDGSFFDFPSGMSDIEDELIDEMFSGLSLSFFSLYASPEEEMMDSGSSRGSDRPQRIAVSTNSRPRSSNEVGNPLASSRSRSSYQSETRSRSSYQSANGATISRSTVGYHRENDVTNLRSRSSYHQGNGSIISSPRSSYHRGNANARTSLRARSSYPREYSSTISRSRSSYHRENAPASSRTRSRHQREYDPLISRASTRYYRTEVAPRERHSATRYLPGPSRQPRSSFGGREE